MCLYSLKTIEIKHLTPIMSVCHNSHSFARCASLETAPCGDTRNPVFLDSSARTVPMRKKGIKIENPLEGCGFTTKNRAKRFVSQGRAEWVEVGVSIRFVSSDHRHH